jgi:ATP-dependent DNA helicase RecG
MTWTATTAAFTPHSADRLPVPGTSIEHLAMDKVAEHVARARRRQHYGGPEDAIEYLEARDCLAPYNGEVCATIAGLLCFGRNPQAVLPHAVVDLGHYAGTEAISSDVLHLEKNIGGTIFDQLERVEHYIHRNTFHGMTLPDRGYERVEIDQYPPAVIRELGVNMLAHRDYGIIGSASRVVMYANRIDWISPGGLPPGVSVDTLIEAQQARNPMLLRILHEAGYVEAFGQGLDTVVQVLRQEQMDAPSFRDIVSAFIVTVYGRQLDQGAELPLNLELTKVQRQILVYLRSRHTATPRDLREYFTERTARSIQRDIRALMDAGLVEQIGESVSVRYTLRES